MPATLVNVRGCNGSGKTTLLRCLARSPECRLVEVYQPLYRVEDIKTGRYAQDKLGKPKGRPIVATVTPDGLAILGDYTLAAASSTTAGCDRISRQADIKAALLAARELEGVDIVLFEGVIVSTIFKPWLDFALEADRTSQANTYGWGFVWAFLDTPLDICLGRIQERNGGKAIQDDLVADKRAGIERVRQKVINETDQWIEDIHWKTALKDVKRIIAAIRAWRASVANDARRPC